MSCGPSVGVFTFVSDAGSPGLSQENLAFRIEQTVPDGLFFGGRNAIPPATQVDAWAAFSFAEMPSRIFPAVGMADDYPQGARYQLPDYYHVPFENGQADFFVLDSTQMELGGEQWQWFREALRASCGLWKIVVLHTPFVTASPTGAEDASYDWGFGEMGVDLVLGGAAETAEHIDQCGLDVVNASSVLTTGHTSATLSGSTSGARLVWSDTSAHFARIAASPWSLSVDIIAVSDGCPKHSFTRAGCRSHRRSACLLEQEVEEVEARVAALEESHIVCATVECPNLIVTKSDGTTAVCTA